MGKIKVLFVSIYSDDGGGHQGDMFHKNALIIAHEWRLLEGGIIPSFYHGDGFLRVPEDSEMIVEFDDNGFKMFLNKKFPPNGLLAQGGTPELNPKEGNKITIYASAYVKNPHFPYDRGYEKIGLHFSFHGNLIEE